MTEETKAKRNQAGKEWRERNKEYVKRKNHEHYIANRENRRKYNREWRKNNREKSRRISSESHRRHYHKYRHKELLKLYGIGLSERNAMLFAQRGLCPICECLLEDPCVDHCHTTGIVRGLLCDLCNIAIGRFKDSPERLRRAADYLENAMRIGDKKDE